MPPIPGYLILIFVIIFLLTTGATVIRVTLYQYLVSLVNKVQRLIKRDFRGQQPKIVEELERRFQLASSKLEQVNTAALIDQAYSQEKFRGFTCEQIDYVCRILPNLLLSFGLFGTFLGITINLSSLSQIINQSNASDVTNLVNELKKPLEGMSIAFTTSLIGIFLSALLTVINSIFNTSLAKYKLISSLEDYLDNIYFPQVQGDTRLDKIVNKMVSQQDEFLTNFGQTVRDAVEKSMTKVAQQITDGNLEASKLARQVYERFTESAGTISAAADEFDHAISELNAKSHIFKESAEIFERSQFPEKLSAATSDLATTQERFSESAARLAKTTQLIESVVNEVQQLGSEIKLVNQNSIKALELHQANQNSLTEIIPQMKQGANSFQKAVTKLDKLEQKIADKVDGLGGLERALTELVETVKTYTLDVKSAIADVSNMNNQKFQMFINNIEEYTNLFSLKIDSFKIDIVQLIQNGNATLSTEYKNVGSLMVQGIIKQTELSQQNLQNITDNLEKCVQSLNDTKWEIYRLRMEGEKLDKKSEVVQDNF